MLSKLLSVISVVIVVVIFVGMAYGLYWLGTKIFSMFGSKKVKGKIIKQPWWKPSSGLQLVHLKCQNCGEKNEVQLQRQGTLGVEIAVWVFTVCILGWVYSIWRYMGKVAICPNCGKSTTW